MEVSKNLGERLTCNDDWVSIIAGASKRPKPMCIGQFSQIMARNNKQGCYEVQ